jgi:UDP-N-acetylglucosamine--N-acetylmuramyl-(pentapeptide) pyrophosphoryl-undecaprenol N-acetylglucosamine transferase
MRLLLAGGGTGGHVYPALSVAAVLPERAGGEAIEFLFAGTERGDVRRLATSAGIPFAPIRSAPVRGRSAKAIAGSSAQLLAGTYEAWRLLGRFRPRAVLATGGYASVPVGIAAAWRRIPLVLYLPDVYPGWAVRFLARTARRIATSTEASANYLPRKKTVVTGYPIRPAFWMQDRTSARTALGLEQEGAVLLVTGATQGSQVINLAVLEALPRILERCSVVHQTGAAGVKAAMQAADALPEDKRARYRPAAYLDNMPAAMAAADLAVMRSGASSLAEPAAVGLPTVLVPADYAGAHQRHNAVFMAERGAAVILPEERLPLLAETVIERLDDSARLRAMGEAARSLARPDAARALADILLEAAA